MLVWLALLLLVILGGFGFTAWELQRLNELRRVDDELERRLGLLQNDLRTIWGPPFGMPPGGFEGTPADADKIRAWIQSHPPPLMEEESRVIGSGGPEFPFPPLMPMELEPLVLSQATATAFAPAGGVSYYYAAWNRSGTVVGRSANAPEIPRRVGGQNGRTYRASRDQLRELYYLSERGECVVVGASLVALERTHRTFAWSLLAGGLVVMAVALGGAWVIIKISLQPVRDIGVTANRIAAGELGQRIPVRDDRGELGQLSQVLNTTFTRLETAFTEQKNFTADASHELRTPVTIILTETQRALNRERTVAEYRMVVETCRDTAREMTRLIEMLLQLARFDAGQDELDRREIDLAELTASVAETYRSLAADKLVHLRIECAPVCVLGDPDRLRQVVANLIQNAIQYNRPEGEVRVAVTVEGSVAVLTVVDTGVGIAAKDLPHVFSRFYRADKARSRAEGNCGLGLAICRSITEAHKGTITVASTLGTGSTFTVRLPR